MKSQVCSGKRGRVSVRCESEVARKERCRSNAARTLAHIEIAIGLTYQEEGEENLSSGASVRRHGGRPVVPLGR